MSTLDHKVVSIHLSDVLRAEASQWAAKLGMPLDQFIIEAIREGVIASVDAPRVPAPPRLFRLYEI